jgi:hypothetical protein
MKPQPKIVTAHGGDETLWHRGDTSIDGRSRIPDGNGAEKLSKIARANHALPVTTEHTSADQVKSKPLGGPLQMKRTRTLCTLIERDD